MTARGGTARGARVPPVLLDDFAEVRRLASARASLKHVSLALCPEIDYERRVGAASPHTPGGRRRPDPHAFAHVDDLGGRGPRTPGGERAATVCVSAALAKLPRKTRLGILYHEVGHLLDDEYEIARPRGTEAAAMWERFLDEAHQVYTTAREAREQAAANFAAWAILGVRIRYGARSLLQEIET